MTTTEPRRVRIDRLDLDLRGIDPARAQAALQVLGPALATVLGQRPLAAAPAGRIDAGRLASPAAPAALAQHIAARIAGSLGGGDR
jgi:hypothetical protein